MTIRQIFHRSFNEQRKPFRKNLCSYKNKIIFVQVDGVCEKFSPRRLRLPDTFPVTFAVWFFPGLQIFERMRRGEQLALIYTASVTFNSNDTWLSEIVILTTLKLFGLRSRGLQSRCGKNSHSGSTSPNKSSSASARSSRFRLCCKDFAKISSISNWFTKPSTAAHIHRFARWFLDHLTWPSKHARFCKLILIGTCFPIPGTLSMGKLTLNRPSLQSLICNLPYFGRHVTSPNQGLSSLASWGVKRRDPGNEVGNTRLTTQLTRVPPT